MYAVLLMIVLLNISLLIDCPIFLKRLIQLKRANALYQELIESFKLDKLLPIQIVLKSYHPDIASTRKH